MTDPDSSRLAAIKRSVAEAQSASSPVVPNAAIEGMTRAFPPDLPALPASPALLLRRLDQAWEVAFDRSDVHGMIAAVEAVARLTDLPALIREQYNAHSARLARISAAEEKRASTVSDAIAGAYPDAVNHLRGVMRGDIPASPSQRTKAALKLLELGVTRKTDELDDKCRTVDALHEALKNRGNPPRAPGVI
jgi:hypothetical protein